MTRLPLFVTLAVGLALTAVSASSQDPLSVSPQSYRLEFENAWVKVVRVTYGPKTIIPPHSHTERASAYVYLNDGGPILFKHEGLPYAGVTRPATKAGSFRVYKGIREVHSVENPTEISSEFLRVEFKTDPVDEASLKGKFFRDEPPSAATAERVQFDNAQVRVTRARIAAGGSLALSTTGEHPALVVALTDIDFSPAAGGAGSIGAGRTAWLEPGQSATLVSAATPGEALRFDFKTRPMDSH